MGHWSLRGTFATGAQGTRAFEVIVFGEFLHSFQKPMGEEARKCLRPTYSVWTKAMACM
jgi:hypothetical protein